MRNSLSDLRNRREVRWRPGRSLALAAALTTLAATNALGGDDRGVTDFSGAKAGAIEVEDITSALAVPRGTIVEASAPPTVRLPIFFEFNSTQLRPEATLLLDKVGSALASEELDTFRFSIEGHTDDVGSNGYNRALSAQRAAAVQAYLIGLGVPRDRLGTVGHGEDAPVAPNESETGRQRNRRVEVINLGSAP